jgi:hypothetical protein
VSGDPAGIALARRVNARYANVPGVASDIKGALGGVSGANGVAQIRLVDGKSRVISAKLTIGGKPVAVILNRTGVYTKVAGATCWTRNTSPKALASLGDPAVSLRGVRFAKPVKSGTSLILKATDLLGQYGGGVTEYTIDAKVFNLVSLTEGGSKMTFKALDKAPVIPRPRRIC